MPRGIRKSVSASRRHRGDVHLDDHARARVPDAADGQHEQRELATAHRAASERAPSLSAALDRTSSATRFSSSSIRASVEVRLRFEPRAISAAEQPVFRSYASL